MIHDEKCEHCENRENRHFELLLGLRDEARKHLNRWKETQEKALVIPDLEEFVTKARNVAAVTSCDDLDKFLVEMANQIEKGIREIS